MIDEAQGRIDYDEWGSGPVVVLLPGPCRTGSAWRPVIAAWGNRFRSVTTSLLGYVNRLRSEMVRRGLRHDAIDWPRKESLAGPSRATER
jgi:pimeloyl-ACP methyl ester carboxylesterase